MRSKPVPRSPSRLAARIATYGGSAVAAAIGSVTALAYAQARRVAGVEAEREAKFWVDGRVGGLDGDLRRVVWLGDSLAAGLGAIAPELTLPQLVAAQSDVPTHIHSYAVAGATGRHVVANQLPALEQLRHGLAELGGKIAAIGVSVGANDIGAFTSRRRFRRHLHTIVSAAEGTPITFVSIPSLGDALRLPHPLRALASARATWLDLELRRIARTTAAHYASVRGRPHWISRRDRTKFLSPDRFHPSGAGYAVWAASVAEAFERAMRPAPSPSPTG